jgi:hypothetical protein
MPNSTQPPSFVKAAGFEDKIDRWQDFEYFSPSSVLQWVAVYEAGTGGLEEPTKPSGPLPRLFHHATPAGNESLLFFLRQYEGKYLTSLPTLHFITMPLGLSWRTKYLLRRSKKLR